jgi:Helix-turn-helix domain
VSANSEPLLDLREAAKRLRMGESTLRQKLYAGQGPVAIKLPHSDRWRFRPADLDAYERAGELTPEALISSSNAGQPDAPLAAAAVPRVKRLPPSPARKRGRKSAP